jgi:predicted nucleotidyltransferase
VTAERESGPPTEGQESICQILREHGVDFVLIGGVALNLHAYHHLTDDLDILFRSTPHNIAQLGQALEALGAHARDNSAISFEARTDLEELATWEVNLFDTRYGRLDCLRAAPGAWSYEPIHQRAETRLMAFGAVQVASLRDLIAMKRAAGREKDLAVLPVLRRLYRQQKRQDRGR